MRLSLIFALTFIIMMSWATALVAQETPTKANVRSLRTEFTCNINISTLPEGTKTLTFWVPVPSDSEWQQIESVKIEGLPTAKITQEPRFGNRMVYVCLERPQAPIKGTVRYTVNRREMQVLAGPPRHPRKLTTSELAQYVAPETSLPVGGRFLTISEAVTTDQMTPREKARALYEHVVTTMQYDYNQESPKFGQGDATFVCDYKRGDCTDLHSYLISLLRTQKIPVVHEYGFPVASIPLPNPLPQEAKITSYHCYACFYDAEYGWVPVDASDAIRWADHNRPEMKAYQFGNQLLERNAVAISRGRNLVLSPPQKGAPVNKFVFPYAEADGKPIQVDMDLTRRLLQSNFSDAGITAQTGQAPTTTQGQAGATTAHNQDLQKQIDELRRLVEEQAKELAALRRQAQPTPAIPAEKVPAPTPKAAAPTPPPTVPSHERLSVYGFLRLDAMRDSSLTNNIESPLYVLSPSNANKGSNTNSALAIHPRLSRLGINLLAPTETSSGWKISGKLEMDWQNGSGLTAESRPIPRIRHAYFELQRGASSWLFGQTWDVISPLMPSVNDDTLMWDAGNLGDRRPQIRYTYEPKSSPFSLTTALGLTGAVDAQDLDGNGVLDGEDSGLPNIQMREAWKGKNMTLGVWGHYAWETTTKPIVGHRHFTSYSLGMDGQYQLAARWGVMGEFWVGQNLSDFRGGIGQGVIPTTGAQVRSHGGWAELGFQVSPKYKLALGYTAEAPEADDIPIGGRISNGAIYLHNRYRLTNNVDLGLSYLYWTTEWKGQSTGIDHRVQTFIQHNF